MRRDAAYLQMAARLAWRGFGRTSPNPMVGCVIVSPDGVIIGAGHHRVFGGAHAEVEALASCARAGHDPRGATAYVTLEPCSHFGKQPPCADALVAAGVTAVVAATLDPGDESGGGFATLEDAGVRCTLLPEPSAVRVGSAFVSSVTRGLPVVTCKWAQTIDGFVATGDGDSQWISGERSRRLVHRVRGRVDAVLVGAGTVRADDPLLIARGVRVRKTALRVVLDTGLTTPLGSRLVQSAASGPVVIYCADDTNAGALRDAGVEVVAVGEKNGRVEARAALAHLSREHAVQQVLCEAGPTLTGALIREGLAEELLVFTAPMVLGDPGGLRAVEIASARTLDDARAWRLSMLRRVGDDAMSVYSSASG